MGQEIAQRREWSEDRSLDWHLLDHTSHQGVKRLIADLNRLYAAQPALHQVEFDWQGFEWINPNDADNSVFSFLRRAKDQSNTLVVVLNATPVVRKNYVIGVPHRGFYREVLNTDSTQYGGSNTGNLGGVQALALPHLGRPFSLSLTLPPLAALFLLLDRQPA
jgi:1,4-alpha-glucan branching enzyme